MPTQPTPNPEPRREPVRTCIGCRAARPQSQLLRGTVDDAGQLQWGRARPGRGAWLCSDGECWERAVKRNAWSRALRRPVLAVGSLATARRASGFRDDAQRD